MKRVTLFRHGKSDWYADFSTDFDRPLAQRGIKAARRMGRWLAVTEGSPNFCTVSAAVRTRQTYELASKSGDWNAPVKLTRDLYEATEEDYLEALRMTPEDVDHVVLIGHEPTCSGTVAMLVGGTSVRFPTGAMAHLELHVNVWDEVARRTASMLWFMPPRNLGSFMKKM